MPTMKTNTATIDALIAKANRLPERGGEPVDPVLQAKTVSPTESVQEIVADTGYDGLERVSVSAVPSNYIGSAVERFDPDYISASDAGQITGPAGYYPNGISKILPEGYYYGLYLEASNGRVYIHLPCNHSGWIRNGNSYMYAIDGVQAQAEATITPTEEEQIAVDAGKYTSGSVKVAAIPSDYVGSGVPTKDGETIYPSETTQVVVAKNKYMTGNVIITPIPNDYIGSAVTLQDYYTGSDAPDDSLGNDGDLYLKV